MRWRRTVATATLGAAALLVATTASMSASPGTELDPALCAPDQNTFSLTIHNSYFLLSVDQQWIYQGKDQGQTIGLRITVLDATETFYSGRLRVTTRVVEELEWEDANANAQVDAGETLIEVSNNYFAQTQDGTVCYFGEAVNI
jgi:hypothetical protein